MAPGFPNINLFFQLVLFDLLEKSVPDFLGAIGATSGHAYPDA
jgi:hypothetical protein